MREATSLPCASRAMQGFMPTVVTVGTTGRGRLLLYSKVLWGTGVGSNAQKAEIKQGINPERKG